MGFAPIEIDRKNLTIMGVTFPDLETLDGIAHGLGTNMYEGLVPTKRDVEIVKDYSLGKISFEQMVQITIEDVNEGRV
jgi:Zn-dependent alcohol dehydrogenase